MNRRSNPTPATGAAPASLHPRTRFVLGCGFAAMLLLVAGCADDGATARMRQRIGASPATATALSPPTRAPTETPDFGAAQPALQAPLPTPPPPPQPTTAVLIVVQTVEATRLVEVVVTPTPALAQSGIDESAQPCPAPFWRRGRCTASAAQIAQYAESTGGR
jgi:hypothetical protein